MGYAKVASVGYKRPYFSALVVGRFTLMTTMAGDMGLGQVHKVADATYNRMERRYAA